MSLAASSSSSGARRSMVSPTILALPSLGTMSAAAPGYTRPSLLLFLGRLPYLVGKDFLYHWPCLFIKYSNTARSLSPHAGSSAPAIIYYIHSLVRWRKCYYCSYCTTAAMHHTAERILYSATPPFVYFYHCISCFLL